MDKKIIIVLAAVLVVIVAVGAYFALSGDDAPEEKTADDASEVAASFADNYEGELGDQFNLELGYSAASAKAQCSNGTNSPYGSPFNYVTFEIGPNAKELYETNKADYELQIGKNVMGSMIYAVEVENDLDGTIGYYNNAMGFGYFNYTGYVGNVFFESYMHKSASLEQADFDAFVKAVCYAIDNPLEGDVKAPASKFANSYSGTLGNFKAPSDNTSVIAKAAYDNGNTSSYGEKENFVKFVLMSDAADEFAADKEDYASNVGKNVMGSINKEISSKGKLTDGYGYFNNFGMGAPSTFMYYSGYYGNIYINSYVSMPGTLTEADFEAFVNAIGDAVASA